MGGGVLRLRRGGDGASQVPVGEVDGGQPSSRPPPTAARTSRRPSSASFGEWVSITKGQRVQRQQAAARAKEAEKGYEATSFEAKEAEWQKADLAMNKGGAEGPGGLDNWMAKQANN